MIMSEISNKYKVKKSSLLRNSGIEELIFSKEIILLLHSN